VPADSLSPLVYVSYAWRSRAPAGQQAELSPADDREAIVDELCRVLDQEDQIVVGRDKKLVKTGDSIVEFAGEIARGGLILAVISHKSLRSDRCMVQELLQAFLRRNFDPEEFGSDVLALMEVEGQCPMGSPEVVVMVGQPEEIRSKPVYFLRAPRFLDMPSFGAPLQAQGNQPILKPVPQRFEEKGNLGKRQDSACENTLFIDLRTLFISSPRFDLEASDCLQKRIRPPVRFVGQLGELLDSSLNDSGAGWALSSRVFVNDQSAVSVHACSPIWWQQESNLQPITRDEGLEAQKPALLRTAKRRHTSGWDASRLIGEWR